MTTWRGSTGRIFICCVALGIIALTQAGSPNRRWSVRKTGEFGRRIDSVSRELQQPARQFRLHEQNLDVSETRRYDQENFDGAGIKRPSVNLELPLANSVSSDQEAEETGESEGYVYAKPEGEDLDNGDDQNSDGYNYNPPPSPIAANPAEEDPDPTSAAPAYPSPVQPDFVAGPGDALFDPLPLARHETEEEIDSAGLRGKKPNPSSPQIEGVASKLSSCSNDDDPNCWTHDYSDVIPGVAGTDYPVLAEIVETNFDCDEQEYSGYYADFDERARCQIFHICLKRSSYRKTRKWSFLCPNGTIFSQRDLVCVLWTDAPECNEATVRALYNINQELGWDNVTEEFSSNRLSGKSGGELQPAMSAFLTSSTRTNSGKFGASGVQPPSRPGLPYRVPVKTNEKAGRPRTKLQEVTQNALHGTAHELDYGDNTEHETEESSNFETSLKQQSESRYKTKSSSALHKSSSEGYELKGSSDGVPPFIVNRPGSHISAPTDAPSYEDEQTEGPQHVIMMHTRQRLPDGSDGYAEVPVMLPHGAYSDASEGYSYPNPNEGTSTLPPTYLPPSTTSQPYTTTTEDFPPPTIPTEPPLDTDDNQDGEGYYYPNPTTTDAQDQAGFNLPQRASQQQQQPDEGYQYEPPSSTESPEEGYRYPRPTTTEGSEDGYRYPSPTTTEGSEDGYRYPSPTTTEESEDGYRYPSPTTTEGSEDGYRYPSPTTTERQEEGYQYPNPTTQKNSEEGYQYPNPTSTEGSDYRYSSSSTAKSEKSHRYRSTTPVTATTGSENTDSDEGYRYPVPKEQLGYNYPAPEATDRPKQESSRYSKYPDEQYTTTDNQVAGGYGSETETTTTRSRPRHRQNFAVSTENSAPTRTTTVESESETPAGSYLPPNESESKPVTNDEPNNPERHVPLDEDTVGIAGGDEEDDDYDEEENEVVTGPAGSPDDGGYNYPTPSSSKAPSSGGILESDDKYNDILQQIQNGGIEAVDANGKPIAFDKLKKLLLSSPPGSVELKGVDSIDSVTSPSTDIPTSPQTELPVTQPEKEQPFYHTVTTANVLPPKSDNDIIVNTNQNPANLPQGLYLPPNANLVSATTNTNSQQPQYYNSNELIVERPKFEIKLPNREFESHSLVANVVDDTRNRNNNQFIGGPSNFQPQSSDNNYFPQESSPLVQNAQYQQQQQYYSGESPPANPTLSTSLSIPKEDYLPPSPQHQQQEENYAREPSFQHNLVVTSTHQSEYQNAPPSPPSAVHPPQNEFHTTTRQATSSILQPQYYDGEANSKRNSNSQSAGQFLSEPIQLTENIQLQKSFAQPLHVGSGNGNPLLNPKNIKIVPAVFVHQHTSVAGQNRNGVGSGSGAGNIDSGFQNLDTAQSVYHPSDTASKFGTRNSIAEQLNQLANSVYQPESSRVGRLFTRRSNGAKGSSSPRGRSSSEPSHTIEKATQVTTFTLEDARTPEELQKYHHEDLKRFHSQNIAKQGGVLDESYVAPLLPPERPSQSVPRVQHRFESQHTPPRSSNERRTSVRTESSSNGRGGTNASSSNSNQPNRFSLSTSNLSGTRGGTSNEDFFIPVSGSYGGSGGGSSSHSSSSRDSNSDGSQFRVNGRSAGGRRHTYLDSESESTLLSRFLPEEEGGFGAKL